MLIVGGSGRVGQLLRQAWRNAANEAPIVLWQARRQSDFAAFGGPSMVFDPLAQPEMLSAAVAVADVVVALAGVTAGSAEDLAQNTALAEAMVAAAQGKPVLVVSSAAVYGAPPDAAPLPETAPLAPISPYGAAKAAMEAAVAGRPGVTVLRIGNIAGADALLGVPAPEEGRLLDVFANEQGPYRSYIGPQALARALARLARRADAQEALPDVVNLALPGAVAMEALLDAAGESWAPRQAPAEAISHVALEVGRAIALGLVPATPATAQAIWADLAGLEDGA